MSHTNLSLSYKLDWTVWVGLTTEWGEQGAQVAEKEEMEMGALGTPARSHVWAMSCGVGMIRGKEVTCVPRAPEKQTYVALLLIYVMNYRDKKFRAWLQMHKGYLFDKVLRDCFSCSCPSGILWLLCFVQGNLWECDFSHRRAWRCYMDIRYFAG